MSVTDIAALPAVAALEAALVSAVDGERMMRHVRYLSTLERHSGTDAERAAFAYIANECRDAGITDVREYTFDAYLSFPVAGWLYVSGVGPVKAKTRAFAASTDGRIVEAEIIYVPSRAGTALFSGDGSRDFDDYDVRGKIVLSDRGRPDAILAAGKAGALGHIHYWATDEDAIHEQITTTIWGTPTPETIDRLPTIPSIGVTRADGLRLVEAVKNGDGDGGSGSGVTARLSTHVLTEWRRVPLVVAHIAAAGSDDWAFCNGHVDSWYTGTTDNATGNAACLEIARIAWAQRDALARGVRVAWWPGHSQGRYAGSQWYADNFWADLHDHALINLNIDSPGAVGAHMYDVVTMGAETETFATALVHDRTGQHPEPERPSRAGDQSFWGAGVPSLYMLLSNIPKAQQAAVGGCGMNWWWHTESDTIDTADAAVLALDTTIYAATLARVCGGPVLPFTLAASAREIATLLAHYGEQAGDRFDLAPAHEAAAACVTACAALDARAEALIAANADPTSSEARAIVAAQKAVTRALVPLRYTAGNRFEPDAAMPAPALQLLRSITELATLVPESNAARFLATALVRRRNAVCHALREATAAAKGIGS